MPRGCRPIWPKVYNALVYYLPIRLLDLNAYHTLGNIVEHCNNVVSVRGGVLFAIRHGKPKYQYYS